MVRKRSEKVNDSERAELREGQQRVRERGRREKGERERERERGISYKRRLNPPQLNQVL